MRWYHYVAYFFGDQDTMRHTRAFPENSAIARLLPVGRAVRRVCSGRRNSPSSTPGCRAIKRVGAPTHNSTRPAAFLKTCAGKSGRKIRENPFGLQPENSRQPGSRPPHSNENPAPSVRRLYTRYTLAPFLKTRATPRWRWPLEVFRKAAERV